MKSVSFYDATGAELVSPLTEVSGPSVLTNVEGLSSITPDVSILDYSMLSGGIMSFFKIPPRYFEASWVHVQDPVSERKRFRTFFIVGRRFEMVVTEDDATYSIEVQPTKVEQTVFAGRVSTTVELVATYPFFKRLYATESATFTASGFPNFEFSFEDPKDQSPSLILSTSTPGAIEGVYNVGETTAYPVLTINHNGGITSISLSSNLTTETWTMAFNSAISEATAAGRTTTIDFTPQRFSAENVGADGSRLSYLSGYVPPLPSSLAVAPRTACAYSVRIVGNATARIDITPEFLGV